MERAIGYIRVSTDKQVTGTSLESQKRSIQQYVVFKGYLLDRLFVEEGESAKTDKRSKLQALLEYCKAQRGRVAVVVFPKIDRFARYAEDYHSLKSFLRQLGIRVESTDERFDDSPAGRYMENVLAATAQFENDIRSERCRGGMKAAAMQGRWVFGRAPLGYRNTTFNEQATIEPDPRTAPLVVEAFQRLASGSHTPASARRWLASEGISLARNTFYSFVRNKVYLGIIDSFGLNERGKPPFVPLISESIYRRAQQAIAPRRFRTPIDRLNIDFPLRGTVRCVCGAFLTASWSKGRSKRYPYYRCKTCSGINYHRLAVERVFVEALRKRASKLTLNAEERKGMVTFWQSVQSEVAGRAEKLEREIERLNSLRSVLAIKVAEGVVPDDVARQQFDEFDQALNEKRASLEEARGPGVGIEQILEFVTTFAQDLVASWYRSSLETRKLIQTVLYPAGATVALESGRTAWEGYPPDSTCTFGSKKFIMVDPGGRESEPSKSQLCKELIRLYRAFGQESNTRSDSSNCRRVRK
jgi:site-specific DNA recombinase